MKDIKQHFDVPRETIQQLEKFVDLLLTSNKSMNLIGKSTEADVWSRHVLDSLQILKVIGRKSILDIGTGAGFPGVVVSIVGGNQTFLVEKSPKKCAFLRRVKKEIEGSFEIINQEIEGVNIKNIDVITCRGFASIKKILQLISNTKLHPKEFVLLKGRSYKAELEEAKASGWNFDVQSMQSLTSEESVVLTLSNMSNISKNE